MANNANNGQQNNGINQNSNLSDQQQNGNFQNNNGRTQSDDMFGGFESEEDKNLQELLSGFGDEADDNFEVGDDWLNPPKEEGEDDSSGGQNLNTDEEDGKALMQELEAMMKQISIDDAALPENFDWTDRTQAKKLLNHTAQKAAVSALAMLTKPMKKYVESVAEQLRKEITTSVQKGGIQGKIQEAFEPFKSQLSGEKNKQKLVFATQTFKQALNAQKDPRKAAITTQRMLRQIGINVQLTNRQGNVGNEGVSTQRFEGAAALDDLFGSN